MKDVPQERRALNHWLKTVLQPRGPRPNLLIVPFGVEPVTVELFAHHGFSGASVWKVETRAEGNSHTTFALKRHAGYVHDLQTLQTIHRLLEHLPRDCGLNIARPIASDLSAETLVRVDADLFELAPWLSGRSWEPATDCFSPLAVDSACQATRQLLSGWKSSRRSENSPAMEFRLDRLTSLANRQSDIRQLVELADEQRVFHPAPFTSGSYARSLCEAAARLAATGKVFVNRRFTLQPVLTDLWTGNLLLDSGYVTGVIDYASLKVDLVELMIARLVGSIQFERCYYGNHPIHPAWTALINADGLLDEALLNFLHQTTIVLGAEFWLMEIGKGTPGSSLSIAAHDRARLFLTVAIRLLAES